MIKLPLLDGAEYVKSGSQQLRGRRSRFGTSRNGKRYWREDALDFGTDLFPLTAGFEKVPGKRLTLFNKALDSYQRVPREATPNYRLHRTPRSGVRLAERTMSARRR